MRDGLPRDEQETLVPCPACDGTSKRVIETAENYRIFPCKWCEGRGFCHLTVFQLFTRWQRIKLANHIAGRCI